MTFKISKSKRNIYKFSQRFLKYDPSPPVMKEFKILDVWSGLKVPVLILPPRLLYLHCNQLADWAILDTLRRLRKLSRLTLHCNPLSVTVSTERNQPFYFKSLLLRVTGGRSYRPTLIANLPQLRSLDFSLISEEERDATMLGIRAKFVR